MIKAQFLIDVELEDDPKNCIRACAETTEGHQFGAWNPLALQSGLSFIRRVIHADQCWRCGYECPSCEYY